MPNALPWRLANGDQFAAVLLHIYDVLVSLDLPESLKERLILAVLSRVVS